MVNRGDSPQRPDTPGSDGRSGVGMVDAEQVGAQLAAARSVATGQADDRSADAGPSCPHCGGTGWRLVVVDEVERALRCSCYEQERRHRLLAQAGIPQRYRHCTLDSFEIWNDQDPSLQASRRKVQDFIDRYPKIDHGLLLMGKVGTGKTHLAVAALQELIRKHGCRGRFIDFATLVQEVQMTFDGTGGRREIIDPYLTAEVLVLDELGASKATPWVMDLLYYLVNTRYLEQLITIFTTNYSDYPKEGEESLTDRISARIRSRLFEMCQRVVLIGGKDYREYLADRRQRELRSSLA